MSSTESTQLYCKPMQVVNQATSTQTQPPVKPKEKEEELYKVVQRDNDKGLILERAKNKEEATENKVAEPVSQSQENNLIDPYSISQIAIAPPELDLLSILTGDTNKQFMQLTKSAVNSQPGSSDLESISPFDLAYRNLMKEYNKGKMSYEDFIKKYEMIKKDAAEDIEGDQITAETKAEAAKYKGLTETQINQIKSLKESGYTIDNFQADDRIPGAITATQNVNEVGIVKSITILPNGDKLVTETDKDKEGWKGALMGERGGIGTGLVGAAEIIGGICSIGSVVGTIAGIGLIADGARRIKNAFTGGTAYTATITKANGGSQETIQHNYKEGFFSKVFKKIGILN